MQPSANIDLSAIREAIARRAQGGGGTPAVQQMSAPGASLPTGGSNVPTQQPPQAPQVQQNVTPGQQGSPVSPEGAVIGKLKQGASFDDETRNIAKSLITKLMGAI